MAILCVRNEEAHLRRVIGDFAAQGIDVAIIDHGSSDDSHAIYSEFLGRGLLTLESLPWTGVYDQTAQLQAKQNLAARLDHDWIIHTDADEWLQSPRAGESLLDGLSRISELGYNAVNFEEFVFLPGPDSSQPPVDCRKQFLDYYFFAPSPHRLMRAWKHRQGLSNISSGGHVLSGSELRLAPEAFLLRHYIVLSQAQAIQKYGHRVFAYSDLAKGWHQNRLNLAADRLQLPDSGLLKQLPRWDSVAFDRSDAKSLHYWEWPRSEREALERSVNPHSQLRAAKG